MPTEPAPHAAEVYSTAEIDAMFAARDDRIDGIEERVEVLELDDGTDPGPGPDPEPDAGVNLQIATFVPPSGLAVGVPVALRCTVRNAGDTPVPAGTIIGVGFLVDAAIVGNQVTYASSDAGLAPGATLELGTDTAGMSGGAWTPANSGAHKLTAYVDDVNRIPESIETDNKRTVDVEIADAPPAPDPGSRPFADSSLWNTRKSPSSWADGAAGRLSSLSYGINNGPYSHPIVFATNADPIHTIDTPNSWGWPAQRLSVHMSDSAQPASGTDGHLSICNFESRQGVDLWILQPTGHRAWRCESYAMFDPVGPGFGQASPFQSAGVTACGSPTIAGTITRAEILADPPEIPHALCMAFDWNDQGGAGTCGTGMVYPAIHSDVNGGPGPMAEGMLLVATGTKPSGLNAAEEALWQALTTYGAYVVDKLDGAPMFYGDRSNEVGSAFRADKVTAIGRQLRAVKTW